MRLLISVLAVSLAIGVTGCGGGPSNETVQKVDNDFAGTIKKDLEAIAESGRVGSGYSVLISNVTALAKKDPDKAEAIKKAPTEMLAIKGVPKIKEKAKEIIKML